MSTSFLQLFRRRTLPLAFYSKCCKTFWATISREALLHNVFCELFRTKWLFSRNIFLRKQSDHYLYIYLSVYLSIYLSMSACLSVFLSIYLCIIYICIYITMYIYMYIYICLYINVYIYTYVWKIVFQILSLDLKQSLTWNLYKIFNYIYVYDQNEPKTCKVVR